MSARVRSLRFGALEAVVLIAFGLGAWLVWSPWSETRARRADESAALDTVQRVAAAEERLRKRGVVDSDSDGTAEFGTLDDLAGARLLDDPVRRDAEGPYLAVGGYRIEVLRPERIERDGRRRWVRGASRVDPALAPHAFAVTAIPAKGADRGLRSFYLDAEGRLYAAEGVQDADRDPSRAPPGRELRDAREEAGDGPVWRLAGAGRIGPPR